MRRWIAAGLMCVILALAPLASAKHYHSSQGSSSSTGQFDFYVLSLSWAPTYCSEHPSDHSSECQVGQHKGFVLHGLWPQAASGAPPMSCGTASPVASDIVNYMLQYFPSRSLIQHEWQEHGTCSGLSAQDYFHQVEQAFKEVQVPDQYRNLNHTQEVSLSDLEQSFAAANHAPANSARVSCHAGELVNLEICLSKNLQFQACTASVRECPASGVSLLPPQ